MIYLKMKIECKKQIRNFIGVYLLTCTGIDI